MSIPYDRALVQRVSIRVSNTHARNISVAIGAFLRRCARVRCTADSYTCRPSMLCYSGKAGPSNCDVTTVKDVLHASSPAGLYAAVDLNADGTARSHPIPPIDEFDQVALLKVRLHRAFDMDVTSTDMHALREQASALQSYRHCLLYSLRNPQTNVFNRVMDERVRFIARQIV